MNLLFNIEFKVTVDLGELKKKTHNKQDKIKQQSLSKVTSDKIVAFWFNFSFLGLTGLETLGRLVA